MQLPSTGFEMTWCTPAQAIHAALKYPDDKRYSLTEIMGYTSHAFRLKIGIPAADVGGPCGYDWPVLLPRMMNVLGYGSKTYGGPTLTPPSAEELTEALEAVQRSIDRGIPAIAWDLFVAEFGIVYGYDDEQQLLSARDPIKDGTLPYAKLGRGQVSELFVMTIDPSAVRPDRKSLLKGALSLAVEHARSEEIISIPQPGVYKNGLEAYDAWIQTFKDRTADPFGNAYCAKCYLDARAFAVQFLRELDRTWAGDGALEQEIRQLSAQAAGHYAEVEAALRPFAEQFPFPQGGRPNDPEVAEASVRMLEQAKAAESQGVETLERMAAVLEEGK